MVDRKRSFTCDSPPDSKKIFIKRSVGKNPTLDLSMKQTLSSTVRTLQPHSRTRALPSGLSLTSLDASTQDPHLAPLPQHTPSASVPNPILYRQPRKQIDHFIDYRGIHSTQPTPLPVPQDYHSFENSEMVQNSVRIPRLLNERRPPKVKEHDGIKVVSATMDDHRHLHSSSK